MATAEERAQAQRLLKIHQDNLAIMEEKKAKYGLETPLWLENQIAETEANIALLLPLAKPPPSKNVQEFVSSVSSSPDGPVDLMMLFLQGVQINARMTRQEEQNQKQDEQNQAIIDEQSRASVWRMQTGETIEKLAMQFTASEHARKAGAKWYRIALLVLFALIVFHYFGVW